MPSAGGDIATFAATLDAADDLLLTCHGNPDGDALGSLLAMAHMLRDRGKRITVYNPDPVPANLAFLPGVEWIERDLPTRQHAWLLIMDCASPHRVGAEFDAARPFAKSMVLDHHRTERSFGDVAYVDPAAAATAELVVRVARTLEYAPTPAFATCAYTGIFTDTGSFRFGNTSAGALAAAADMAAAGARPNVVAEAIVENQPEVRLRVLAEVLDTLELAGDGQVAMIAVRDAVMRRHGARKEDIEGFVDYPRSLKGVLAAAQIREVDPDAFYKVSLRSKYAVDVESVAARFGGGGHMNASGCAIEGTFEQVRDRLRAALVAAVQAAQKQGDQA